MKKAFACILAFAVAFGACATAYAYETDAAVVRSGVAGTSAWTLYDDDTLVFSGGAFTAAELYPAVRDAGATVSVVFENAPRVTGSATRLLYGANVDSISGELVLTGSVAMAFSNCTALETFDLDLAEGSHVTNLLNLFSGCTALASADLSGWDVSGVLSVAGLFRGCTALTTVDTTGWDTSKVVSMGEAFSGCTSLATLDLSGWDVSAAEGLYGMFSGCTSLATLDLTGWNVTHATYLECLFEDCRALAALDLTGWDATGAETVYRMFAGTDSLRTLVLDNPAGVSFLSSLDDAAQWALDGSELSYAIPELVVAWDNARMAGTWRRVEAPEPAAAKPAALAMYRLYNPNSGEHFYTASASERDATAAAGWTYEGVGWYAPETSSQPVYRLYSGTDHHYTMSVAEKDMLVKAGWTYEGVAFYSDESEGVALLRQYNPNVDPTAATGNSGSHNYTASPAENDWLVSLGWLAEGVGWYGIDTDA